MTDVTPEEEAEAESRAQEIMALANRMREEASGHEEMVVLCATVEVATDLILDILEHSPDTDMYRLYEKMFSEITREKMKDRASRVKH